MKKRLLSSLMLLFAIALTAIASEPQGYYTSAYNLSNDSLRQALYNIIKDHTVVSYANLYNVYQTSDVLNGEIWDIYSTCSFSPGTADRCGNYVTVCDCYNREHTVPQSWFNSAAPMNSDAFHIYPTDGKVNGQRSNYPYGECANGTSLGSHALGRLGTSTFTGYTSVGTVFEPDDEYKGDLARTYFYMATRYANICSSWGHNVFSTAHNGLSDYSVALLMKWHREDPVSQKEIDRNEAIYAHQHNRNPFIDYPELAEHIWGNKTTVNWDPTATGNIVVEDVVNITISPIPATNEVVFSEPVDYTIYAIDGTNVLQGENTSNANVATLPEGFYIIRLTTTQSNKECQQKLIIKR
ncbi:MAG: endonuclease [Bacteroidales bacterium]|nr:endonuclease [Bacteroidales bacterium]